MVKLDRHYVSFYTRSEYNKLDKLDSNKRTAVFTLTYSFTINRSIDKLSNK